MNRLQLLSKGLRLIHKMSEEALAGVPLVHISPEGIFKYVMINVFDGGDASKAVIRGFADCTWHGKSNPHHPSSAHLAWLLSHSRHLRARGGGL